MKSEQRHWLQDNVDRGNVSVLRRAERVLAVVIPLHRKIPRHRFKQVDSLQLDLTLNLSNPHDDEYPVNSLLAATEAGDFCVCEVWAYVISTRRLLGVWSETNLDYIARVYRRNASLASVTLTCNWSIGWDILEPPFLLFLQRFTWYWSPGLTSFDTARDSDPRLNDRYTWYLSKQVCCGLNAPFSNCATRHPIQALSDILHSLPSRLGRQDFRVK